MAVFVDAKRWETFEDEVEGYRDLFGGALTLLSLASNEPHYPVRYVAEDPEQRRALLGPVTMALLAWFVLDSSLSILNGFAPNAVSNVLIISGWVAGVTLSKPRGS